MLVAVGAVAFVDLGMRLTGSEGGTRTVAYVISGTGFLGAGVIMKDGMNVRGLNTAATLWRSAAVWACAGADLLLEAAFVTVAVLACNPLLRPLVNAIDRAPIDASATGRSRRGPASATPRGRRGRGIEIARLGTTDETQPGRGDYACAASARLDRHAGEGDRDRLATLGLLRERGRVRQGRDGGVLGIRAGSPQSRPLATPWAESNPRIVTLNGFTGVFIRLSI